jgi:hypothetical protein
VLQRNCNASKDKREKTGGYIDSTSEREVQQLGVCNIFTSAKENSVIAADFFTLNRLKDHFNVFVLARYKKNCTATCADCLREMC